MCATKTDNRVHTSVCPMNANYISIRPEGIMLQKVFIILFRISPKFTTLCSILFFLCYSLCQYSVLTTNDNKIYKLLNSIIGNVIAMYVQVKLYCNISNE